MSEGTSALQPEPERDDLGLTLEDWFDLQTAYNYGLLDPRPGTVQAKAFERMDAYARQEVDRVHAQREADEAYALRLAAEREAEAGS
jgi:hypothetical protein